MQRRRGRSDCGSDAMIIVLGSGFDGASSAVENASQIPLHGDANAVKNMISIAWLEMAAGARLTSNLLWRASN